MTVIKHELKQSRLSLLIWTASIGFLIAICVFLFPEMKGETDGISDIFASMGGFSEAFGMNKINFGTLTGFYAIECGNILGLGGAFFAALTGISLLAKEEKDRTAEFLFTHPVSRFAITAQKLVSSVIQIIILNSAVYLVSVCSIMLIGEPVPLKEITLLHLAYLFLQLEISFICFGISAFIRGKSAGIGMGVAVILYFLNIIANISESAEFLKYVTPFGYADGAEIISKTSLDAGLILLGLSLGIACVAAAFIKYSEKDIV